jgi:hypothetical protein
MEECVKTGGKGEGEGVDSDHQTGIMAELHARSIAMNIVPPLLTTVETNPHPLHDTHLNANHPASVSKRQ